MKPIVELWAPVLINDGIFKDDYLVSNMGRVKKKRTYKNGSYQFILMHIIDSKRPLVKMSGGGRDYRKSVAKLVLSSFQYRKGCECANITYLDGDMKNCRLSNLRYTTDKAVYTNAELKDNKKKPERPIRQLKKYVENPSCKICSRYPCFDGMDNLNTDFAAEGCRKYEPKK